MAKKNLTIRLDDELREQLQLIADGEMRPLANQVVFYPTKAVEYYKEKYHLVYDAQEGCFRSENE